MINELVSDILLELYNDGFTNKQLNKLKDTMLIKMSNYDISKKNI